MASAPGVWEELSQSSKRALRWAGAAARLRAERGGRPVDAAVDEFDLLVGIMLAHPTDSPPRVLLSHVGATASDVLPAGYPVPAEQALERHAERIPENGSIPLTAAVEMALMEAKSRYGRSEPVIELAAVFGALLLGSNEVAHSFQRLLDGLGAARLMAVYAAYLREPSDSRAFDDDGGLDRADLQGSSASSAFGDTGGFGDGSFAAFLHERFPLPDRSAQVPSYQADHGTGAVGDDYVDIRAEVDAFAYLLSSCALRPPLAVGLFGDWGSGKTYFMDAMRSRIGELIGGAEVRDRHQSEVPFWKHIVQIEFNAWHYVGGDLWASLVEHLFSELGNLEGEAGGVVAERQGEWLAKIDQRATERAALVEEKEQADKKLKEAQDELEQARSRQVDEQAKLDDAEADARAEAVQGDAREAVRGALAGVVPDRATASLEGALEALAGARAELARGRGLLAGFGRNDWRTWLAVGALALVPVAVWVVAEIAEVPVVAQAFAGISALLAAVTGGLRAATAQVRTRLDRLDEAERTVRKQFDGKRLQLQQRVADARTNVEAAANTVEDLTGRTRGLDEEIRRLHDQMGDVTSSRLLAEFVKERFGSTDYRKRLGTAAIVQRDFRQLSDLIEGQNAECLKPGKSPEGQVINRIVLYIDDLDRCDAERVVQVLQAVHLLLAFPLFVVVVAVDSRWLAEALEQHYPALAGADGGANHATPADYLEKIFQVPFWVDPLADEGRRAMLRGLLQDSVQGDTYYEGDDPGLPADPLEFQQAERNLVSEMFSGRGAVRHKIEALTMTSLDLHMLEELAPLVGTTPRSIKRFVNVFQLLCVLPVPDDQAGAIYRQRVALLLALAEGLPALDAAIQERIRTNPEEVLRDAVEAVASRVPPAEMARYEGWQSQQLINTTPMAPLKDLAEIARRVRRFTFQKAPAAASPPPR